MANFLFFLLNLSGQPAPLPDAYPYQLVGSDGFKYRIITDKFSDNYVGRDGRAYTKKPVLSVDGSALYDGWRKSADGKTRWIRVSFKQLLDEDRLEGAQPELPDYRSPLDKNSIYLSASASLVHQVFSEIQKNPAQYLKGSPSMTTRKVEVVRRMLFESELLLTREDLKDLARNHANPDPAATEFEIDLIGLIEGWQGYIANPFTFEMKRTIQVDELRFKMANRIIIFDSEKNRFRVELLAESASIKGPIHDTGDVIFLMDYRTWDEFYNLEQGQVSGVKMAFDLQFAAEDDQFWLLEIVPHTFTMEFLETPPLVKMEVRGFRQNGDPYHEDEPPVPLIPAAQKEVQKKITSMISNALAVRFFTDGLSVKIPVQVFDQWLKPNRMSPIARLSSAAVSDDGLVLGFDSQFDVEHISDCLSSYPLSDEPGTRFEPAKLPTAGTRWGLGWNAEEGWKLLKEDAKKWVPWLNQKTEASVFMRPQVMNRALGAAWRSGVFCMSTRMWWPRPGHIPLVVATPYAPPQVSIIGKNEIQIQVPVEVTQFARDHKSAHEKYSVVENSKRVNLDVNVSLNLELGYIRIAQPKFTSSEISDAEMELFKDLLARIAYEAGLIERRDRFSHMSIEENFGQKANAPWLFKGISSDSKGWIRLDMESRSSPFGNPSGAPLPEDPIANALPMRTSLIDKPGYIVNRPVIGFRWNAESGRNDQDVFYSHRLIFGDDRDSSWSPFTSDREVKLPLKQGGKYRFEVKAMNRWFEIEDRVHAYHEFYYEPEDLPVNEKTPKSSWQSPRSQLQKSRPSSSEKSVLNAPKRAPIRKSAEGPFGCSIREMDDDSLRVFPVVLLVLKILALVALRARRHFV